MELGDNPQAPAALLPEKNLWYPSDRPDGTRICSGRFEEIYCPCPASNLDIYIYMWAMYSPYRKCYQCIFRFIAKINWNVLFIIILIFLI